MIAFGNGASVGWGIVWSAEKPVPLDVEKPYAERRMMKTTSKKMTVSALLKYPHIP